MWELDCGGDKIWMSSSSNSLDDGALEKIDDDGVADVMFEFNERREDGTEEDGDERLEDNCDDLDGIDSCGLLISEPATSSSSSSSPSMSTYSSSSSSSIFILDFDDGEGGETSVLGRLVEMGELRDESILRTREEAGDADLENEDEDEAEDEDEENVDCATGDGFDRDGALNLDLASGGEAVVLEIGVDDDVEAGGSSKPPMNLRLGAEVAVPLPEHNTKFQYHQKITMK